MNWFPTEQKHSFVTVSVFKYTRFDMRQTFANSDCL